MKNLIVTIATLLFALNGIAQDSTQTLSIANNRFALDFYKQLSAEKQNLLISPFSASSALGMTYMGARKKTAAQMAKVLHLSVLQKDIPYMYTNMLAQLNKRYEKNYKLKVANSIWVSEDLKLLDEFSEICTKSFMAEAQNQDFTKPKEAVSTINQWVENKTNNKIKNLLREPHIMPDTKLILVNALYFRAEWNKPFQEKLSEELPFFAPDTSVTTTFMHSKGNMEYAEDDAFQYLKIPYKGSAYLLLALPQQKEQFDSLAQNFSFEQLSKAIAANDEWSVDLYLPKFKIESDIDMTTLLQDMGMPDAFTSKANFEGITGKKELQIGAVVQKTFIELDENGTEAAAATAVVMKRATSMRPNNNQTVFRADHPFLFFLMEENTDAVLFMGHLLNPVK